MIGFNVFSRHRNLFAPASLSQSSNFFKQVPHQMRNARFCTDPSLCPGATGNSCRGCDKVAPFCFGRDKRCIALELPASGFRSSHAEQAEILG
ncbi:hypothetical protein ACE103_08050 [Bradyrhizobium sp. ma5]|uniref:hypothetical protein n=1 Tax=Bradyrhizobium sp. ma5 TaxID=3344828 RepID=UPI0035D41CBA